MGVLTSGLTQQRGLLESVTIGSKKQQIKLVRA